jgi:hypothetical protein
MYYVTCLVSYLSHLETQSFKESDTGTTIGAIESRLRTDAEF